ncbi:isoamylase [Treponema phagedenis]|uniref:Isoamylase n=1 Tax=Treponema phagedenis TaxID=162 RepID=A0A0B7GW60_TREPH|nr:hypothetical protein [Treponema phagedenis]EFW39309.1 isoamylase N-terminal domain protein [Treponema phagedenis F0421]NVP23448.1 isoamylase [Treponema phagedenis]QEJ95665.1 isoamylase [Treponema phagedenis]QEJ98590.1 isoamylase [Treponema phagedenis]QEK01523.1 isoamylase [Treponema phagedenis]
MKSIKLVFFLSAIFCAAAGFCSEQIEPLVYNSLVDSIHKAKEPSIQGKYIIFTANGSSRYAGIAFAHENYKKIYSFKKLNLETTGKTSNDPVLFFIMPIPEGMRQIRYRMVIDGLWTADPYNANQIYDYAEKMSVSILDVPFQKEYKTNVENGLTQFVYQGEAGQRISLAGTFNAWDPFMYVLKEISPGYYELYLPLPPGTWLYAFFKDGNQLPDIANSDHVYTVDGRTASVLQVK